MRRGARWNVRQGRPRPVRRRADRIATSLKLKSTRRRRVVRPPAGPPSGRLTTALEAPPRVDFPARRADPPIAEHLWITFRYERHSST